MKHPHLFLLTRLIPFFGFALLFSSCAPAPNFAPAGALQTQLHEITRQQQEQSDQLQLLQQQLDQLRQQLIAENVISTLIQGHMDTPGQLDQPTAQAPVVMLPEGSSPQTFNQDVVNVAASASSYLAAFSNLAAGHLPSAETGFQEFLRDFPDHQYAPNARFWLANAQLSQGKTNLAMANLQQIVVDPNAQTKAPAALMQLAQLYRQEGLQLQADNILEQLRNRFPESPEAQQIYRGNEPTN